MGALEKPATQKEMLYQVWYAVIGSNGDGIASITRKNREDIEEIKESTNTFLRTREATCPVAARRDKIITQRIALVAIGASFAGAIIGGIIPVVFGG